MKSDYPGITGQTIQCRIDRPIGSRHPQFPETVYPVNYGYAIDFDAEDGEKQDVYVLGIQKPIEEFTGRVTAVYRRQNDCEDKWIVEPDGAVYTDQEILDQIQFQEKYFRGILLR